MNNNIIILTIVIYITGVNSRAGFATAWMTGHLKHLMKCRQKALKDNCPTQFKFYRNQVNRERKYAKAK